MKFIETEIKDCRIVIGDRHHEGFRELLKNIKKITN
jgi:hypothetical protein